MGRGFLAGIFWGGIVGFAMLAVSSFVLERQELSLPRPEAVPVEVPAGTEFDQARPETDPVVPEAETRPESEQVGGVTAPADAVETPPAFDTSSLEVPQPTVDAPNELGETPEIAEEVDINVTGPSAGDSDNAPETSPELASPEAPASAPETVTEAPTEATAPDTDTVAEAAPEIVEETAPVAPTPEVADTAPTIVPRIIQTESAEAPATPEAPQAVEAPSADEAPNAIIRVDGGESEFFKPVDEIGNMAQNVETDRLPRIGAAPEVVVPDQTAESPQIDATTDQSGGDTDAVITERPPLEGSNALKRWASSFEIPGNTPLISIVLVHSGDSAIPSELTERLPDTVAFAIDAGMPRAVSIANEYRALGREVVMIPSLPIAATPQDVEQALRVNFETVPEAVAVMDNSGDSFQSDRAAVAQVVDVVAVSGHGLITFPRGLNTAHQRAERAGVPTGLIFRDIDGAGESNEQIRRAMDRAAFRARQDEAVILVGRTNDLTIEALQEWVLGNRAASVALVPISAALSAE